MRVQDKVLEALEQARGAYISGESLAQSLAVSRNAVWKGVRSLQEAGHEISALPKQGYRLAPGSQRLSVQGIAQHLGGLPIFPEVHARLPSTTTHLRVLAEAGAPEGTLIVAEEQTAGYGRFGRSFYSPAGSGIYMSLLLRPHLAAQDALCITTCAAVAVCRALETLCFATPSIKWVNDVFCRDKKVCGIGTEASLDLEGGGLRHAILGIGLNLAPAHEPIPADLRATVGTVLDAMPEGRDLRSALICAILREFWAEYPRLAEKRYFDDYERRCFILGQSIDILRAGECTQATALSLAPDFSLRVQMENGEEQLLSSGEVSIRPRHT